MKLSRAELLGGIALTLAFFLTGPALAQAKVTDPAARITELEKRVKELEAEKAAILQRAEKAEAKYDELQAKLDKAWGDRWREQRPTRKSSRTQRWETELPTEEEGTEGIPSPR